MISIRFTRALEGPLFHGRACGHTDTAARFSGGDSLPRRLKPQSRAVLDRSAAPPKIKGKI